MAETDASNITTDEEVKKKGVGVLGGTAALASGVLVGTGTGTALYKTAVAGKEAAIDKAENVLTRLETGDLLAQLKNRTPQVAADITKQTAKLDKLNKAREALADVEKSNFLKKGTKVAFKGGAKVRMAVVAAALAAMFIAGGLIKKARNSGSHADRVEQQRTEQTQSTGQSMA